MKDTNIERMYEKIQFLKKEKNALVLAHFYQIMDIQHIADFCGDSFELAKKARSSEKQIIVFCGVRFMAESAKAMNPQKRILLPRHDAGCPMADMVTPADVARLRTAHPNAAVVCYINSSAETKAVSDICCTSSNAIKVVRSLPQDEIIFIPDKNLGAYIAKQVPEKTFYLHQGWCPIHKNLQGSDAIAAKQANPGALLAVHPECEEDVLAVADFIGSTSEIIKFCHTTDAKKVIVGTELSVVERVSEECPEKEFLLLSPYLVCPNMKKTRVADLLHTLETLDGEIFMTEEEINAARLPLERMLEAGKA
jgi:quinolinate synthetase complex, A subunit